MKKFLCVAVALTLALSVTGMAIATETSAADYSVADKLVKQLWAGSGFSGTLRLEVAAAPGAAAGALSTKKPLEMEWDYIYVRDNGLVEEERRVDLALKDGDTVSTTGHVQLKTGALCFQADLLGTDWYSLSLRRQSAGDGAQAGTQTVSDLLTNGMGRLAAQSGVPALVTAILPLLLERSGQSDDRLSTILDSYITRMDLWIEGYRNSTVLGKAEDGTGTMALSYAISAANIKSQLKQMLLDLLADRDVLAILQNWLGTEYANVYLHPSLQPYYFEVIDRLPLSGDLTIDRRVSLKGNTLELRLSLPFYDATGGETTLRYERVGGTGDLPDENTLALDSGSRGIELRYQEYSSMTDVTVVQGTLYSEPRGTAAAGEKALAVAFTLRQQTTEGRDAEDRDTLECATQLSLTPDPERNPEKILAFEDVDVALNAVFASKTLKTAPTDLSATLTVSGEKRPQSTTLTIEGKTRKQWTPAETPAEKIDLNVMTRQDMQTTLQTLALNAGGLLLPYVDVGTGTEAAQTVAPADTIAATATETVAPAATATATVAPANTTAATVTVTPTATPTATVTVAPTATPTPAATVTPTDTVAPASTAAPAATPQP